MPTLVHLADERETKSILKAGIKIGKHRTGIFCMPVLPDFFVSHQWLRELKRSGARTHVAVYFKMDSSQMVFAGKYNTPHKHIPLGQAIREVMSMEDPLGYELIIDQKIEPDKIFKVKSLPQTLGWRYWPGAHGKKPCTCEYCIRSSIKARKLRERYEPEEKLPYYRTLLKQIKQSADDQEVEDLLCKIQRKKRRTDPAELMFLLDKFNEFVNRALATTLGYFRHRNTEQLLIGLLSHAEPDVREYAADSLIKINPEKGLEILQKFSTDSVIQQVIDEYNRRD